MKPKIAVLLLAVLLCLTTGCNNASHIAETPDPISSSDSNIVPSEAETAQEEKKRRLIVPKAQNRKRIAVPQSSRQAYRNVTPKQQRFPIRLTTARQCCHSQANLKRKQTSPNADRKPLPRLKKNSQHLRQLRNLRHRARRKENRLSRFLTLTTGSALPRATLRASDLCLTAEPCIAGITPLMRMQDVSIWNGTYNLDSIAMRQMRTSPMCGSGMSPSPLAVI